MIDLDLCKPEKDMKTQMAHIEEELIEARTAFEKFDKTGSDKDRAEVLFELLDTMNAAQTAICMMFNDDEIVAGCQYVNSKNFVRHYLEVSDD